MNPFGVRHPGEYMDVSPNFIGYVDVEHVFDECVGGGQILSMSIRAKIYLLPHAL